MIGQSGIPPLMTEISKAFQNGDFYAFDVMPSLIVRAFKEKVWAQTSPPFGSFTEWWTAPRIPGMNREVEDLRKFCVGKAERGGTRRGGVGRDKVAQEALALLDGDIRPLVKHGTNRHTRDARPISTPSSRPNSPAHIIARLLRDSTDTTSTPARCALCADLHARVIAGELSAYSASIEAGYRKVPTTLEKVLKLVPLLTDEEWQQVIEARGESESKLSL
jgi:hypothetical protein